jgi:hypothetical protein
MELALRTLAARETAMARMQYSHRQWMCAHVQSLVDHYGGSYARFLQERDQVREQYRLQLLACPSFDPVLFPKAWTRLCAALTSRFQTEIDAPTPAQRRILSQWHPVSVPPAPSDGQWWHVHDQSSMHPARDQYGTELSRDYVRRRLDSPVDTWCHSDTGVWVHFVEQDGWVCHVQYKEFSDVLCALLDVVFLL